MQIEAKTKFTGISAQKTRLVLDEMRGRPAAEAMALLAFMPQGSAKIIAKTIKSAVSNAVENYGLDSKDLVVAQIFADDAPMRKWRRFGARGRFKPWKRRSSHVTVVLEDREAETVKAGSGKATGK